MKKIMSLVSVFLALPLFVFATSVKVSWDANTVDSDLAGYKVYYGTTSRTYSGVVDVGNITSYILNNLDECTTYYFAVTAYDTSGNESAYSIEVSEFMPDKTPPTGSINTAEATTTKKDIVLTLSASDTCGTITTMVLSNDGLTYTTAIPFATTYNWTLTDGLGMKTIYVKYMDNSGNESGAYTTNIELIADTTPPTPPTNVKVSIWEQIVKFFKRLFHIG